MFLAERRTGQGSVRAPAPRADHTDPEETSRSRAPGCSAASCYTRCCPDAVAPLAIVILSVDLYIGYAVGGITDFLFAPLLAGAADGWDKFSRARCPTAWLVPVLIGLAMAVKQTRSRPRSPTRTSSRCLSPSVRTTGRWPPCSLCKCNRARISFYYK